MFARWLSSRAVVGAIVLLAAGCGGSGTSTATPAQGSSISGTIEYAGASAGGGRLLAIAVYPKYPPSGPPIAWKLVESYQFPYHYFFDNLPPGNYVVGASIDVDPSDTRYAGMLNAKRDPFGYSSGGSLVHLDEQHGVTALDIQLRGAE